MLSRFCGTFPAESPIAFSFSWDCSRNTGLIERKCRHPACRLSYRLHQRARDGEGQRAARRPRVAARAAGAGPQREAVDGVAGAQCQLRHAVPRRDPAGLAGKKLLSRFLCPLLGKYGTFIARCNALIEKVSTMYRNYRSPCGRTTSFGSASGPGSIAWRASRTTSILRSRTVL
eukprot:SAG31_NODE_5597_length_2431_cov_3.747856_1_plen_174_part_00